MENLQLPLTGQWFEMTKSGEKKEDYRDITAYWFKRLVFEPKKVFKYLTGYDWDECPVDIDEAVQHICETQAHRFMPKPFANNIMTWGYPKAEDVGKFLQYKHKGIEMRTGNPDWGAKSGVVYFVIKHGKHVTHGGIGKKKIVHNEKLYLPSDFLFAGGF